LRAHIEHGDLGETVLTQAMRCCLGQSILAKGQSPEQSQIALLGAVPRCLGSGRDAEAGRPVGPTGAAWLSQLFL
jgi:hypothetical protein